jgi:N-acetylglucosaminyldiphosphoundecaprenol N-acetyl-beta-D-mannosaminyltransferase
MPWATELNFINKAPTGTSRPEKGRDFPELNGHMRNLKSNPGRALQPSHTEQPDPARAMRYPDHNISYPSRLLSERDQLLAHGNLKAGAHLMLRSGAAVLDTHIDAISPADAILRIVSWAAQRQSRYVTLCNVHSVVTASQCPQFSKVLSQSDLALPDGAPIAWALRREGFTDQRRVNGPDLTWSYLEVAERIGQSVFFYGSSDETLGKLKLAIQARFPKLRIAGMVSPPFRELTPEEDQAYVDLINKSGANAVFVGLGCPKQEAWMAAHRGRIQAVMLGVGAAFDYHAGTVRRAPVLMQRLGPPLCGHQHRFRGPHAAPDAHRRPGRPLSCRLTAP